MRIAAQSTWGLATDGTADALSVSLGLVSGASSASLTLDAVDIENLTVVSQGADGNVLTLDDDTAGTLTVASASVADTDLKSITILGDKNLTVTHSGDDSALASIDASAFTGSTLSVDASSSEAAMTVKAGGAYSANITAGKGADTITVGDGGTANANTVNGGDGADTIVAGAGNDTLNAGDDGGKITAGAGDDTVSAGDGADTIDLGDGNDRVTDSGAGADVITGGAGNDTVVTAGAGADSIDGGAGNDDLSGGADNDTILGGAGNDTLNGDAGNDSIVGGDGNDTITDGAGNDVVLGGDGVDTITISTGNDNVDAGAGNDVITITGLSNADTITGGDGTDSLTITNSSTGTLTPQFTSIESLTVKTSVNFALNQTDATDKTSLKTFTISSTESTSDSVNLTKIASGSTVNISEDFSWDGASASDTDDTGDIGEVNISTVDGGTLTLNVHADQDAVTHADTTFANVTDLTGAATITINSKNSDSNDMQNSLVALGLDNDETQTLVLNAEDSAGLVVGNVTNAAALQSLTFSSAAGAVSTMGTMITATSLNSLSLSSTGSGSSVTIGKIGNTTDATLESLTISASGSSTTEIDGIDSANSTALTSVSISATGANSKVVLGGDATNIITVGTGTIASLVIDVADNAILEWADDSITSGTITAGTLSFGNYSVLRDEAADGNEDLTLTGAVTTLGVSLGRGITNAAADSIVLSGAVTTLNLSSTLGSEAVAMDTSNDLAYGGNELIQFGAVTKATYTHTGTGAMNWVGDNIATNIVSSNASSTTDDTIEGGSANDVLKGNAGGNIMEGNAGNDTIYGYAGADSITGSAGNDVLESGEGADTVDGGAGNDTLTLTESTAAADVARLTNGVAAITTVGAGAGDDAGADTITGYDTANDKLTITATGVTNFVHGTDTGFGQAGAAANAAASTANVAVNELATTAFYFDFDTASNVYLSTATVDMVVNMASLKTSGVAYTLTSDTAMEATIAYSLTGTAAADTITTGGLADAITGGAGADIIDGGAGVDTFTFGATDSIATTATGTTPTAAGIDTVTVTDGDLFNLSNITEALNADNGAAVAVALNDGVDDSTIAELLAAADAAINADLAQNDAVLIFVTDSGAGGTQDLSGLYLIGANDATASANDTLIKIVGTGVDANSTIAIVGGQVALTI